MSLQITPATTLGELVDEDPSVLEVLEEFGIRIDPWTLIALRSNLIELAEYSAVEPARELGEAVERWRRARNGGRR